MALHVQNDNVTYIDSFGVEHIHQEIKIFTDNKNIETNIFRIQAYDSIICGYFCFGVIDFMLAGKTLAEFTNKLKSAIKNEAEVVLRLPSNMIGDN